VVRVGDGSVELAIFESDEGFNTRLGFESFVFMHLITVKCGKDIDQFAGDLHEI
jgi:hypothetical protein